ncbi:MAG: flagellar basal-body MS-ring/collar protein FliF, partial [Bacillota bacterium]
ALLSGSGFELFDQQKFGVTDYEQQVAYQRALQEELRRTIVQLEEVEQARVHLVLPRKSLFIDEQTPPSASVVLKLKPGARLEPGQVKGLVDLIAGSVQDLKPENVHIIDLAGNSLTDALNLGSDAAALSGLALQHYEVQREYEKALESRVAQLLGRILGPGKAVAMVSAELDFSQQQTTSVNYGPSQLLSKQEISETSSGGSGAGGVPGAESNLPGGSIPAQGGEGSSSYSRQQVTTNYQVPSQQQTVIKPPGTLKKLSVSVVLNGNYPQNQIDEIRKLVATAVGYDETRGDSIAVSGMAFDDSLQKEFAAGEQVDKRNAMYIEPVWIYLAGGLLLAGLLVGMVVWRRRRRYQVWLKEQEELRRAAEQAARVEEEPSSFLKPEEKTRTVQDDLKEFAREHPNEVADILKLWLKE